MTESDSIDNGMWLLLLLPKQRDCCKQEMRQLSLAGGRGGGGVTVDEVRKGLTSPAFDCWLKFVSRIRHHLLLHGSYLGSQVLLKVIEQIQFIMFSRLWDPNTVPFLGIHLQVVRSP